LLRAVDELHEERTISGALWQELRPLLSDVELIELCMLVGHYEMLAMTLASLGVQPEAPRPQPSGPDR
jgi:alkylhydroperoxidase family enzyme